MGGGVRGNIEVETDGLGDGDGQGAGTCCSGSVGRAVDRAVRQAQASAYPQVTGANSVVHSLDGGRPGIRTGTGSHASAPTDGVLSSSDTRVSGYGPAPAAQKCSRGGTTAVVGWPEGQPRVAMASLNVADGRMAAEALAASGW